MSSRLISRIGTAAASADMTEAPPAAPPPPPPPRADSMLAAMTGLNTFESMPASASVWRFSTEPIICRVPNESRVASMVAVQVRLTGLL